MEYSPRLKEAFELAKQGHEAIGQKRKYTNEPYWHHPKRVMELLANYTQDEEILIAALFHDWLEDVTPLIPDVYNGELIKAKYGDRVRGIVHEVTNMYTKELFPHFSRLMRKRFEVTRLSKVSLPAKMIKISDMIDNLTSIVYYDKEFARVYVPEKRHLLNVIKAGDESLKLPEDLLLRADMCLSECERAL